jgi:hypothetical protein
MKERRRKKKKEKRREGKGKDRQVNIKGYVNLLPKVGYPQAAF